MHCIRIAKIGLIFLPFFLPAQTPDLFWTSAAVEDENIQELAVDSRGRILVGATFEEDFLSLSGAGGTDLALVQLSATGDVQWRRHFGSQLDDEWSGIAVDAFDDLYAAGSFWVELSIDELTFRAEKNAKALFLGKFAPDGALRWARKIEGTGLKIAGELAVDEAGGLLMAGYFSDTLFLGEEPLVARGRTDLFAARFRSDGQLDWATRAGQSGNTRALSLAPIPGGAVALTGFYDDTTRIGPDQLLANTFDRDVFVCLLDNQGQPQWARRAGGVHDDAVTAIRYGPGGRLYVAGYLIGVISLSDELSIQSSTGNSDFYLLVYDTTGTPVTARAYGGRDIQQATGLTIRDDQLWLSGFHQGEMTIDDRTVDAGAGIGSFLARFDTNLQLRRLYNFPSGDNLLVNALAFDPDDRLLFGGGYTGSFALGGQTLTAGGGFDLFLNQILQATPNFAPPAPPVDMTVFPNPSSGRFYIRTALDYDEVRLIDAQGVPVFQARKTVNSIAVGRLPAGWYVLVFYREGQAWRVPVLVSGEE